MDAGREGPSGGRGKWADPSVPKRGWHCEDTYDLEEPCLTCEMCETVIVRYVHVMRHPDYPNTLECGCICAGHMEQDLEAARHREGRLRKRTARRSSWPKLKGWHRSKAGNWTITKDGIRVTVVPVRGQFAVAVSIGRRGVPTYGRLAHPTPMAAREASFGAYEWGLSKRTSEEPN